MPIAFPRLLGSFGDNWLLRKVHENAVGMSLSENSNEAAEALASSLGPAPEQCRQSQYSASVLRRAQGEPLLEQIRYYREGLAFGKWEQSNEVIIGVQKLAHCHPRLKSHAGTESMSRGPIAALQAKSTVLWGAKDIALDMRITLAGIEDYLAEHSHVIIVPQSGHWLPLHDVGMNVLGISIDWALSAQDTTLSGRMTGAGLSVDVSIEG